MTQCEAMQSIDFRPVDPQARRLWIWQAGLAAAALSVGLGVLVSAWSLPLAVLGALLLAGLLAWIVPAAVRRYYAHLGYALTDQGFFVRRGIWWQSEVFVPRGKIQHVDVVVGPVARRYGLAQLSFYTAGAHVPQVQISGLSSELAMQLRDRLLSTSAGDVNRAAVARSA